jgi:Glycosyl hydrolases family 39
MLVFVPILVLLLLSLLALSKFNALSLLEGQAASPSNVIVNYTAPLRPIDPQAIGMDISGYFYPDVFANDQLEQQKLKALEVKYMRMHLTYTTSGDPTSKIVCAGDGCDTRWTGDQWITAIKNINAEPVVIVDANSPTDAANMVRHFNQNATTAIHYWLIGNEPNTSGYSPQSYSDAFNQDFDAMKAIDPSIKIGGGALAWYDPYWLQQFLQGSGSRVDFVDFHGYAQQGNVPGDYNKLFQLADGYGKSVEQLRQIIQRTVPDRASQIGIEVGEWELNWGGSAQDNTNFHAVWTATTLGNILKTGGWSLFYADKGNALYGSAHTFTDSSGRTIHVAHDDPNPAYHGIGMFTGEGLFQAFGNTMLSATTTLSNVEVFASDQPKNIVVINKDPFATQTATFSLKGISSATIDVWRKDESLPSTYPPTKRETISIFNGSFTYELPPFSITTFVLTQSTTASSPALPTKTIRYTLATTGEIRR